MPEAPDLEIIKDFLDRRISGVAVDSARVLRPTVLRSLAGDFEQDVAGRRFIDIQRQGKLLLIEMSDDRWLVIDPMLTGALQYCSESLRVLKKTCLVLKLPDAMELRYLDDRQMGKVYYLSGEQWGQIPRLEQQGPDVLSGTTLEEFQDGSSVSTARSRACSLAALWSPGSATPTPMRYCSPPGFPPSENPGL